MGDVATLIAALQKLGVGNNRGGREKQQRGMSYQNTDKPAAPWLPAATVERLRKEGKCLRCKEKGHLARSCPKYSRAQKPAQISVVENPKIDDSEHEDGMGDDEALSENE